MGKKRSHYRSDTKRGFEAGELAGLLAKHSPTADYRVVINFRGKVRELIVEEDTAAREAVVGVLAGKEEGAVCPPAPEQGGNYYGPTSAERFGGKLEAALHDPRAQYPRTAHFPEEERFKRNGGSW